MDKSIYITGFMGVGKSSVARDFAKYRVWSFIDLDQEVESLSHLSINELTEKEGLQAVRHFEEKALFSLAGGKSQVVALGAGTLLYPQNLQLVRSSGTLVYLSAEPKTLIERLTGDQSKQRPLFGDDVAAVQAGQPRAKELLKKHISELIRERLPTYVKADLKVDTDGKSIREITVELEIRLRLREQRVESF